MARARRGSTSHRRGLPDPGHRVVSSACIDVRATVATPYDHAASCPHSTMIASRCGAIGCINDSPVINQGIVVEPAAQVGVVVRSPPDDHLAPCPDRGVAEPGRRPVGRAEHGRPRIRHRVIASPVEPIISLSEARASPDHHPIARPDRGVPRPRAWCVGCICRSPGVGRRVVAASCLRDISAAADLASPHDHFIACPDSGRYEAYDRCSRRRSRRPGVGGRTVASSCVEKATAPDDHFCPGPDRGTGTSRRGGINCRHCNPGV